MQMPFLAVLILFVIAVEIGLRVSGRSLDEFFPGGFKDFYQKHEVPIVIVVIVLVVFQAILFYFDLEIKWR
jgi:ribose/xylose/arabinose/galactoside ABC-type transport system permease subunit